MKRIQAAMPIVLVIDDDPQMRRMIRRILTDAGYDVIEAGDGEAGLALVQKEAPPLVLTDLVMPHKEGIETIREICRASPETKIIAMSGSDFGAGTASYLQAAKKLGADAVLQKPFRATELLQTIAQVLANARPE